MQLVAQTVYTWISGYKKGLFDPVTSYVKPGAWFAASYKRGHWDGKVRFVKYHRQTGLWYFPTGLLERVTTFCADKGIKYYLDDQRIVEQATPDYSLHSSNGDIRLDSGPYSFQSEALDAALTFGRGIIKAPCGAGKTQIGAGIIKSISKPTIWFTHRLNLLYQTQKRFEEIFKQKIGIIGDSEVDYQDITIAMVQSCSNNKHLDFLLTRQVVVCDEVHILQNSELWFSQVTSCPAAWRFGLSATPCDYGIGLALLAATGRIVYEILPEELIQRGVIVRPRIWIASITQPDICKLKSWRDVYGSGIVENEKRNQEIVNIAKVFSLEGKSCLVLISRIKHGETLIDLLNKQNISCAFIRGSVDETERQQILDDLKNGVISTVVATAPTLGEGTDLPWLRALINGTGSKCGGDSTKEYETGRMTIQILGRGLRACPGKEVVDYVDFADCTHKFLKKASRDRLATLEDEGYGGQVNFWQAYNS